MDYIDEQKGIVYSDVQVGPKGGLYVIKDNKKVYLKKENLQVYNSGRNQETERVRRDTTVNKVSAVQVLTYPIADYEHEGDIRHEINYIKSKFPYVINVEGFEERDYEAEDDYAREYGELDEHIYQGYVKITLPKDKVQEFMEDYQ